jgi:hypothetical protein
MTGPVLTEILEIFFDYLAAEDFEGGRQWALDEIRERNPQLSALLGNLSASDREMAPFPARSVSPTESLLAYGVHYFVAGIVVESSYDYGYAIALVRKGLDQLETVAEEVPPQFVVLLRDFSELQADLNSIDRGIYTDQPSLMEQSGRDLISKVEKIIQSGDGLQGVWHGIYEKYLHPLLSAYRSYGLAVENVAVCYSQRWGNPDEFRRSLDNLEPDFEAWVRDIRDRGSKIMARDLLPHRAVLKRFAEQRRGDSGELLVDEGTLTICFFASPSHNLIPCFNHSMEDFVSDKITVSLDLAALGSRKPVSTPLSDLWSGLEDSNFLGTYTWELPSLKLYLHRRDLSARIHLQYWSMGVFALKRELELAQIGASRVRHSAGLATPFAWVSKSVGLGRISVFLS